jgi:hypothetical protein
MSYVTDAELVEIVPELRAMARIEAAAEVRSAMIRLADRYAKMAPACEAAGPLTRTANVRPRSDGSARPSSTVTSA